MGTIAILGSGMAGFGAAHKLFEAGRRGVIFEKHPWHGGHTASFTLDNGFTFDEGPHVSFTKNERVQRLLADSVDGQYRAFDTKVNNYWKGHWIKHPAQCNLYGLPTDLVVDVLRDFVEAQYSEHGEIRNYKDWLYASFGKTFAETFPMQYTVKYHTTTADNMSTDWIGPRLYRPKIDEVFRGALAPATPDVHYISGFRYPLHGGFVSFLEGFTREAELNLGHEAVRIDAKARTVDFSNGAQVQYDALISSMPLPELIRIIDDVPSEVRAAAETLACTEVVIVNLGIDRADLIDAHWTYFYDHDVFFTRLSTPHLQSENNVPPGCGSLQAECYYSRKYRPLDRDPQECIEPVIRDLRKCGLLREDDRILYKGVMHIPYANIIFDLDRAEAVKTVHGFLDDVGIAYCGRYGDWGYLWTDQAFLSGEKAAERVLSRLVA